MVDYIITIVNDEGTAPCGIHAEKPAHCRWMVTGQVLDHSKVKQSPWWPMPMHLHGYCVDKSHGVHPL